MIGATVDQFKIAKLLEKTPSGEVFLAVHGQTGAKFVLHSVNPQLVSMAGFRKNFLDDASRMIKFEHPNVVPLVNVLEEHGRLYLVREYFDGLSLADTISSQSGRLSLEGVIRLFKDILRGMGYAHAEGAIHRFLNPKNILVTTDGEAKIIGFGKVLQEAEERFMEPKDRVFAAQYFSPERIRNPNTTDVRANIYALGAMLHEMSTGKPPFTSGSFETLAKMHIELPLPDPGLANPEMPPAMVDVIKKALAKRPEHRFQNTIEFYKALEAVSTQIQTRASRAGGPALDSALVNNPGSEFQFDLPDEAVEGEFQFNLGNELPTQKAGSGFNDLPSEPSNSFDAFSTAPPEDEDPFSAANLSSGNSSLDFSGFAAAQGDGGLFDLDMQMQKAGQGGSLNFGGDDDAPKQDVDLDRLSFGKDAAPNDAIDLGMLDSVKGDDYADETVQGMPELDGKPSSGAGDINFDLGANTDLGLPGMDAGKGSDDLNFDLGQNPAAEEDPFALGGSSSNDGFDFGNEFPSEAEKDPFGRIEESGQDMDLSFKDQDLNLDSGPQLGGDLNFSNDNLFGDAPADPAPAGSDLDFDLGGSDSLGLGEDKDLGASLDLGGSASDLGPSLELGSAFAEDDPFTDDTIQETRASAEDLNLNSLDVGLDEEEPLEVSYQSMPDMPPEADAPIHKEGLEASLAKIEAADAEAQADQAVANPRKPKKVKKIDKKLLGLTAGLAAIIVFALFYWVNQKRQKRAEEQTITEIQELMDRRAYDQALAKISNFMGAGYSGDFNDVLSDFQRQIRGEQRQIKEQVETLSERATGLEAEGVLLVDGKTDAYGTYHNILSLDSKNKPAQEASDRIRQMQLARAESFLESGQKVDALAVFAALTQGNRGDQETKKRYQALKDELKESRSGALIAEIETLYAKRDYQGIAPKFLELNKIDPRAEFVVKMRRTLVGDLVSRSKERLALRNYEESESDLRLAASLDPNNKKVSGLLNEMGEERLRGDIENTAKDLNQAIKSKDYARQYRLSNELLSIDPGNRTAISALDAVKNHVANLHKKGDEMREVGNFKAAASVYRQIYLIDKNEQARVLWSKYDNWTPPVGMVYIPGGPFTMGNRATRDARPPQTVFVSSFFIDKHEVTNREFKAFVDANPKWRPGRISPKLHDGNYLKHWRNGKPLSVDLDRPVSYVSWYAASAYAASKNKRLPTEAEWEKSATGNTSGKKYWWGNYSDAKMAVYEFYKEKLPAPVGKFPANGFGVYEILGNVNEWTQDSYDPSYYYSLANAKDPVNTDNTKPEKVFRGGSYRSRGADLVLYLRSHGDPRLCHATVGFRCAMNSKNF